MSVTIKNNNLIDSLNELLSTYQVVSQNIHGFHWNIESLHFFPLHTVLGDTYDAANDKIDEIAERIRQLDAFPIHTMKKAIKFSKIKEIEEDITCCSMIIEHCVNDTKYLINMIKEIEKIAMKEADVVTSDIMISMVRKEEKALWMLKSTLNGIKKMKEMMK